MEANWHHNFNPRQFMQLVDIQPLLTRNKIYNEERVSASTQSCFFCGLINETRLLLNDNTYLCLQCVERLSLIEYPAKYAQLKRQHLVECNARSRAREALVKLIDERRTDEIQKHQKTGRLYKNSMIGAFTALFFICPAVFGFSAIGAFGFIALLLMLGMSVAILESAQAKKLTAIRETYDGEITQWERSYPPVTPPELRHFHDPKAELALEDHKTIHVFNHWPGYPPFWEELSAAVRRRDVRCQVSGCPSRLTLNAHHKLPISQGGPHTPDNLIALCEFHHALEPTRGHARIWSESIQNEHFTLVRSHIRENPRAAGGHEVRCHLRRRKLISKSEIEAIMRTYRLACPHCEEAGLRVHLNEEDNSIRISCPTCGAGVEGPQQLGEESGPRMAEVLKITQNLGQHRANWETLQGYLDGELTPWSTFNIRVCSRCGINMHFKRPRPGEAWQPRWECAQYSLNGCRGNS